MLDSMILKTKKRLSNDLFTSLSIPVLFLGLSIVLIASIRTVCLWYEYGVVMAKIPVVDVGIEDSRLSRFTGMQEVLLNERTPMIVLKKNGDFVFGEIQAFGEGRAEERYLVAAVDGAGQFGELVHYMSDWQKRRMEKRGIESSRIVVLAPSRFAAMPVVVELVDRLKITKSFDHVVLAGGRTE
jgi:hypothetical protein